MAATQRLRQGVRALLAFTRTVDSDLAAEYLSPQQMMLFNQMNRSEQLHSLNVLRDVLDQGQTPDDLAVAALLHDVGKICYPLAIWQKTIAVLVKAFVPSLFERWSRGSPANLWVRAFAVNVQHPTWSAELVTQADASERAVWLIAHHADALSQWTDHMYWELLNRLQQADNQN